MLLTSNISRTKFHKINCFSYRLTVVFAQYTEARFKVENGDVIGATPTGDAPTPSEWSTCLLPIKLQLI